jgi:transposase
VEATNHAAERALRPAVIARKTWGGNRTTAGAECQQILASLLRTCGQQGKDTFPRFTQLLRSRQPIVLDLIRSQSR